MPEPPTIPPEQAPKDDPGFANALEDPFWWFYRYRGAIYFGAGGLFLFLFRKPALGVLFEIIAALFILFYIKQRNRKTPGLPLPVPPPAPYADLQASMARLREEEEKEHRK